MAERIGTFLTSAGFDVSYRDALPGRPNVVGTLFRDHAHSWLVFEGHLDTVGTEGMPSPFKPVVSGGRLYGRGATDTKGGVAAALAALDKLAREDLELNLEFVGAVDEEVAFRGVLSYLEHVDHGGFAIVIEPTSLTPVIAHSGVLRGRLSATGRAAHSSTPELGENAISRLIDLLPRIPTWARGREPSFHPLVGQSVISITTIRGGEAINVIPANCSAEFDWRLHPADNPDDALDDLERFLADVEGVEVAEVTLRDSGLDTSPDGELTRAVRASCLRLIGSDEVTGFRGGTDASKFARARGWETLVLGPGSGAQAHTVDEWIETLQIESAVGLYVDIARRLAHMTASTSAEEQLLKSRDRGAPETTRGRETA